MPRRAAQFPGHIEHEDSGVGLVDDREWQAVIVAGIDDPVRNIPRLLRRVFPFEVRPFGAMRRHGRRLDYQCDRGAFMRGQ